MNHKMIEIFEDCPVIAAVKDEEGMEKEIEKAEEIRKQYFKSKER